MCAIRLDLMERFALAPKFKGSRTEAVIKPGLIMQVSIGQAVMGRGWEVVDETGRHTV